MLPHRIGGGACSLDYYLFFFLFTANRVNPPALMMPSMGKMTEMSEVFGIIGIPGSAEARFFIRTE